MSNFEIDELVKEMDEILGDDSNKTNYKSAEILK